jgi:hypothetical protein
MPLLCRRQLSHASSLSPLFLSHSFRFRQHWLREVVIPTSS